MQDCWFSAEPNEGEGSRYIPGVPVDSYESAAAVLAAAGYLPGRIDQESASVEVGLVMGTRPTAGTAYDPGRPVDVFVSVGVPPIPQESTEPPIVILE